MDKALRQFTVKKLREPVKKQLDQDIEWICNSLGFLTPDELDGALLKLTMECGNDNLIGRVPSTSVPEGGMTFALLGLGLLGMVGVRRKLGTSSL